MFLPVFGRGRRTCLGCRLGRFAAERHWRSLTPRHAPQAGLRAYLVAKSYRTLTKKSGTAEAIPDFFGRGRRTRTLGTRFWSGCGRTQPGAGKSRCCPVPAASWREGGAGLVLRGNFSHFREEAHRYLKLVLVFFRLNEYNILGLMYASIVIMRCRK